MRLKEVRLHRVSEAIAKSDFEPRNSGNPLKGLNKSDMTSFVVVFKSQVVLLSMACSRARVAARRSTKLIN